jgi:hypothetical protein
VVGVKKTLEVWLKRSSIAPLRIAGEVLFGNWGEGWEEKRFGPEVG